MSHRADELARLDEGQGEKIPLALGYIRELPIPYGQLQEHDDRL